MKSFKHWTALLLLAVSPMVSATTVLVGGTGAGDNAIESIDMNGDNIIDLTIGKFSFEVFSAGSVSLQSAASDVYLFMMLVDSSSNTNIASDNNIFGPSIDVALGIGSYDVYVGADLFSANDAFMGYVDDLSLGDLGYQVDIADWDLTITAEDGILEPAAVPVPAALPLFMTSLLGLSLFRRRK